MLPQPLLYLSAYFERNRDAYLDGLMAVSERGAWREWVEFFLRGVRLQAADALTRAKQLQDLQREWHAPLTQARNSALLIRLVDHLFESPVLTVTGIERVLDVAYNSARRNADKRVALGILRPLGEASYGKTFVAEGILRVVLHGEGSG